MVYMMVQMKREMVLMKVEFYPVHCACNSYCLMDLAWIFLCAFGCEFQGNKICYFDFTCFESSSLGGDVPFYLYFGSVVIKIDVFSP